MTFRVVYGGPAGERRCSVEANNHGHAYAIAERGIGEAEAVVRIRAGGLYDGEPYPQMPANHARNAATKRRDRPM